MRHGIISVIVPAMEPDAWLEFIETHNLLFIDSGEIDIDDSDTPTADSIIDQLLYTIDTVLDEHAADPHDLASAEQRLFDYAQNRLSKRNKRYANLRGNGIPHLQPVPRG